MTTLIRFLSDYRGVQTNEAYYRIGDVVELPQKPAEILVARGLAEWVEPVEPEPQPEPPAPAPTVVHKRGKVRKS